MDELFEQITNISKASSYDIVCAQVNDLKVIIRELIKFGQLDDLVFTDENDTKKFKEILNKAKFNSIIF